MQVRAVVGGRGTGARLPKRRRQRRAQRHQPLLTSGVIRVASGFVTPPRGVLTALKLAYVYVCLSCACARAGIEWTAVLADCARFPARFLAGQC